MNVKRCPCGAGDQHSNRTSGICQWMRTLSKPTAANPAGSEEWQEAQKQLAAVKGKRRQEVTQ